MKPGGGGDSEQDPSPLPKSCQLVDLVSVLARMYLLHQLIFACIGPWKRQEKLFKTFVQLLFPHASFRDGSPRSHAGDALFPLPAS